MLWMTDDVMLPGSCENIDWMKHLFAIDFRSINAPSWCNFLQTTIIDMDNACSTADCKAKADDSAAAESSASSNSGVVPMSNSSQPTEAKADVAEPSAETFVCTVSALNSRLFKISVNADMTVD